MPIPKAKKLGSTRETMGKGKSQILIGGGTLEIEKARASLEVLPKVGHFRTAGFCRKAIL